MVLRRGGRALGALSCRALAERRSFVDLANRAVFIGILLQLWHSFSSCCACAMVVTRRLTLTDFFPTSLAASPFILSAARERGIFALFICCCCGGALIWNACCPSPTTSTALPTKPSASPFPFSPLMIAAGAYWANRTWGSYLELGSKETWAAITWLVYAGTCTCASLAGWRGRRAAYFAILGFRRW